ncbi:ATP-dependent DNA ligase [Candidatus Micrarchaeota archaeon]|nr:ATP-dependent DNA ligase [Candidatus Micrarchaeota archaeon]
MEFSQMAQAYDKLESTTSRLQMADDLAVFFKTVPPGLIRNVVYLLQGILVPEHHGIQLGIGDKLCEQALSKVSGKTIKQIEAAYRKIGDLGQVAETALSVKTQKSLGGGSLTVEKVYDNLYKLATVSGEGSQDQKISLLAELFSQASPTEAKTIARFVTGRLRLGVAESTIMDALSVAKIGDKTHKDVLERAFNLTSDLGQVAETWFNQGLDAVSQITPQPFNPIRPALAERLPSAKDIIERLGKCSVEAKYDGFRLQVHKYGKTVRVYSRRQEDMTAMFPDIVKATLDQLNADEAILEGEAIGYNSATGQFVPFQETIQRKRKHGVAKYAEKIPLKLFVFELLYADGTDWTVRPYVERQAELARRIIAGPILAQAETKIIEKPEELENLFDKLVGEGLEGIMAKDLHAPYSAGARKFAWIKLKRSYSSKLADSLDVVIIGFYYGKGKRTEFGFGGLLSAIYDPNEDRFRSIAKIGTGFSEQQMADFSELLQKDALKQKPNNVDCLIEPDVWVKPRHVITVIADEITRSPVHTCAWSDKEGLALRFPRIKGFVRTDKSATDATTESEVLELYEMQRQR